jgi:hypothetical protein
VPSSIKQYLSSGPATSKEIQVHMGLSQPTVARKLRSIKENIVSIDSGRSPVYALTKNVFGQGDKLPLAMVDVYGNTVLAAIIRPLAHGGFFVETRTGAPSVLLGNNKNGLYDDLPYFLLDLCPQGFLGRKIAEQLARHSDFFPSDPRLWNTDQIGRYLVSNGDDLPGNFKFGQQALDRIRRKPISTNESEYPYLADSVMSGEIPGSSAGGEQPKFTAYCGNRSAHVIVKFTPRGDNEIANRWRDILLTEYHASETLHKYNFPAAETRLFDIDGRLFLESQRFDRSGAYGRLSMISLQSIDNEFTGIGTTWPQVISALFKKNLVSWQHVYDAEMLWLFGNLINNTDMHLGNLSFAIDGDVFRLLPAYDMCSMGFAPWSGGEISPYNFKPQIPDVIYLSNKSIEYIKEIATDFWDRISNEQRISNEFRNFLKNDNPSP